MCGIAGIVTLSPQASVCPDHLRTMAGQLIHRGPDDEGFYVDPRGRCGFAFRRLAIIDLAGGNQPISNDACPHGGANGRRIQLIFNGEIYNFHELRTALAAEGHVFTTQTDGEVILHLYEQHGRAGLSQLEGMFALALWDEREGRLLLARDRFGKKPLVYAVVGDRFHFASEAKAILARPDVPRELDPQALHQYLLFQYVPAPWSIYRGFHKLGPGELLEIQSGQSTNPQPCAWWSLPNPSPFIGSYADARQRLGELLTRAVEKRLIADVPLGAFLSGGLDSSIVVGLMRRLGVSPLRTFSIGFPDPRYDETRYARAVATHFNTEHHERTVTPDAQRVLETLAWHYDEPFADSSAIPTYYVSRYARERVTVALTGDAGDECFAGYDRYRAAAIAARGDFLPRPLRQFAANLSAAIPHGRPRTLGHRWYRFFSALALPPARRYLSWMNVFPPALLAAGYRPDFRVALDFEQPLQWFASLHDAVAAPPPIQANRNDLLSYLPYDLLTKVDLASMASSLECRSPFLDHELVKFALSLPWSWRRGHRSGKRILRDWARELLPPQVLERTKMGFGVPVGEWFRGELRGLLERTLFAESALSLRIFQRAWLEALLHSHLSGQTNYEHPLWALLMLELWARRWQPNWCGTG